MKGIILAGGNATRIKPITDVLSKQILPVYDKPMIYYPLSVLMLAGIKDILLISTPEFTPMFKKLLGNGEQFGIKIDYEIQEEANGLAQAFIIGEEFINGEPCALILGDNILWGDELEKGLQKAIGNLENGFATVFGRRVTDPENFGVAVYDKKSGVVSKLVEKPNRYVSNDAVIGLYFYDSKVCEYAKGVGRSDRGEYEITELNNLYVKEKKLKLIPLKKEMFEWFDAGSFNGLLKASQSVCTKQKSGVMVAMPEEIAIKKGWISYEKLFEIAQKYEKSNYGIYLKKIAEEQKAACLKKATEKKKTDIKKETDYTEPNLFDALNN